MKLYGRKKKKTQRTRWQTRADDNVPRDESSNSFKGEIREEISREKKQKEEEKKHQINFHLPNYAFEPSPKTRGAISCEAKEEEEWKHPFTKTNNAIRWTTGIKKTNKKLIYY